MPSSISSVGPDIQGLSVYQAGKSRSSEQIRRCSELEYVALRDVFLEDVDDTFGAHRAALELRRGDLENA